MRIRRGFGLRAELAALVPVLLWAGVAGCSPQAAPSPIPPTDPTPSGLAIAVGTDGFVTGVDRVPFVAFDGAAPAVGYTSAEVDVFPIGLSQSASVWHGIAVSYPDYDIPYWVTYPDFPHAGFWAIVVHFSSSDGVIIDGQFAVQVSDSTGSPQVGERPPASHNRTLDTEPDISHLTSDLTPDPDFYRLTVAQALKSGRPTVVTFATPAYCTSRMCAPVLNSVKGVASGLKATVNFIHIEVYKQFQPLVYADEMEEWGLTSEPWTFVVGADGMVVARLGGPLSEIELQQVLAPLEGL
jgi:hypothetical protein